MALMKGLWMSLLVAVLLVGSARGEDELPTVVRASFPEGFVFGTATAAYQYEGAMTEGGKGLSIWDTFTHRPGTVAGNTTGDAAVDQYHRYRQDLWLLKDLNMEGYRFSISWARIFPKGVGAVNWNGVKYYDSLIDHLHNLNIEPYVTLYHWDMPQALEDAYGGWLSPESVDAFTRYSRFCFERWGSKVKYWITFNEIHSFANAGYFSGEHAPGRCTPPKCAALNASSTADQEAAQKTLEGFLGWYLDPIFFGDYPASMRASIGSNLPTFTQEEAALIKGSQDFVGINHYSSMYASYNETTGKIDESGFKDGVPIGGLTPSYWLFVAPSGMRNLLGWVRERYGNPIVYVTENGRDESNTDESKPLSEQLKDPERIQYYHDYLQNVLLAIKDGSDVRGYFAWSLLDNFEWAVGFTVRFGIYYVDYKNGLARYPKDSAHWFAKILKRSTNATNVL